MRFAVIVLLACLATASQWDEFLLDRYGEENILIGRNSKEVDWRFYVNWMTRSYTMVAAAGPRGWCMIDHGRYIVATAPGV